MIIRINTTPFDALLDEWVDGGEDCTMDDNDDAGFIAARTTTIATLLDVLALARNSAQDEAKARTELNRERVRRLGPNPPITATQRPDLLGALEESVLAAAAHRKTRVTARWNVWSSTAGENVWLVVVDSVTEKQARDAADQRNATAEKHGVASRFVAAPVGVEPNEVYAMLVNLLGNVEEGA